MPCDDLIKWGKWMQEPGNIRIAETFIRYGFLWLKKVRVSTVFLGLDHNFHKAGRPVLFETMIFGGGYDGRQTRASSYSDAEKMHREAVALVKGENSYG